MSSSSSGDAVVPLRSCSGAGFCSEFSWGTTQEPDGAWLAGPRTGWARHISAVARQSIDMVDAKPVGWTRTALQLNGLLAVGAASLVAAGQQLSGNAVEGTRPALAVACVLAVYNFDRIADTTPAEGQSTPLRKATIVRLTFQIRVLVGASLAAVFVLGAYSGRAALGWALAFALGAAGYVLPVLPWSRVRRLKDVPYFKAFYVPGCWLCFAGLAVCTGDAVPGSAALGFVAFLYMRLFVSGYLGDLRDMDDDLQAGVRTPAQALGRVRSVRLLHAVHLASALTVVAAVAAGWMPRAALGLLFAAAIGFALFLRYLREPQNHERIFELYDLEMVAYFPMVALCGALLD